MSNELFGGMRVVGTITLVERDTENGCAVALFIHGTSIMNLALPEIGAALDPFFALTNFGTVLKAAGKAAKAAKAAKAEAAEAAEAAEMEALEAKWNACTEDHKNCTTDRPCPVCEFGVGP